MTALLLVLSAQTFYAASASAVGPDVAITKTDGVTTATPGGSVTYTITASNPSAVPATGATVADTLPAVLTATWTCVGAGGGTCTASGSGNINDTVNLPAGGSVTYTVSATISPSATGSLSNTATVSAAGDPNAANNSATDTDTLSQQADLAITKTDGRTSVTPGGSTTYTITASNAGPSNAPGSTVADTLPAVLTATWTCVGAGGGTCTTSGSGNINDTVNLPAGGSVTYTVSASISAASTGSVSNTATVTAPAGVTDPNPANNSATDTDTLSPVADLAITKTDGRTSVTPGGSTTYTITASNAGPSNAPGSTVADTLPAVLTATWTCVGAGGGTCTASGSGNINDTVNLPAGGSVTYTVSASISAAATGSVSNTAVVVAPAGVADPTPGNNSATDTDIVLDNDLALTGVPANITTPATGPTGAVVSYTPPTAVDEDNPQTATVNCLPASGSLFAIGTTTVTCTATDPDDSNSPVHASFTVTVKSAVAQLQDLQALVAALPPSTARTVLGVQVGDAIAAEQAGNTGRVCMDLSGVVRTARQAQSYGQLTSAQATSVINAANQIAAVIGCSLGTG